MLVRENRCSTLRLLLLAAVVLAACGAAIAQNPAGPPVADPFVVPDGPPAELAKFIVNLMFRPQPDAEAQQKAAAAMSEAADKIIAGSPDKKEAELAAAVKMMLAESEEDLNKLVDQLNQAKMPELVRLVTDTALMMRVFKAASQSPAQLAEAVKSVGNHLSAGPLQEIDFELVRDVASVAESTGQTELASGLLGNFSKLAAAGGDPKLADLAKATEPILRRLSLPGNPMKVEGTPLGGGQFDWSEYKGKVVLVYFWKTPSRASLIAMPEMKAAIPEMNTVVPDINAVLPEMRQVYQQYYDKGFEIVGISLDVNRQELETYVRDQQIPWTILYEEGGKSATASYYGARPLPTMILVGRDGNVASLNAREQLGPKVGKLLSGGGAPITESMPAVPGEPGAEAAPDLPLKAPIVLRITSKGVVSIDDKPFDGHDFLGTMAAKVPERDRASTPIHVHAAADAVYDNVVRGIDALKGLGFRTFKYVKVR